MEGSDRRRVPPGTHVYDQYNGMRVGGLVGAVLGAVLGALTSPVMLWAIPVLAVAGAAAGYRYERRRIDRQLAELDGDRPDTG
jgi:hypothetical protein